MQHDTCARLKKGAETITIETLFCTIETLLINMAAENLRDNSYADRNLPKIYANNFLWLVGLLIILIIICPTPMKFIIGNWVQI